jgi:hypothetical protein
MNATPKIIGPCGRCKQPCRPLFPAEKAWGDVPSHLCSPCWSKYADARANKTYVDFNDAFDNASDEELFAGLGLTP